MQIDTTEKGVFKFYDDELVGSAFDAETRDAQVLRLGVLVPAMYICSAEIYAKIHNSGLT